MVNQLEPTEVRAWGYELATWRNSATGEYGGWEWRVTSHKPCVLEGSMRNLTPLVRLS